MRLVLSVAAVGLTALAAAAADGKKPNVIVFLSDDVGYGEYGFQGNKSIPTPNIDSIAKNGVRFTAGYVAATYCSPCRAGLMTGRYPTRFGHEFNEGGGTGIGKGPVPFGLPLTEKTFADRMKELGYATCAVGKWHLGGGEKYLPMARGFDEFYGTVANTPFFNPPNFVDSRKAPTVTPVKDDTFYTTDAYGERAADWVGKQKGKPFFLYLPFNAQHAPLQATEKYLARFPKLEGDRKTFAAMMSAMDDAVGKVLGKVKEMGEEENTLVFFFSDNGGPTKSTTSGNGPLRGFKATTLEGGTRVPFCAQWKGVIPAGTTFDHPIQNLDLLPTAVVAAGGKIDPSWKLDGVDLLPHLTGKVKDPPHPVLYWRFGPQWAIRKGDFKLVASTIDGVNKVLLYNLKDDIGETKDLSDAMPDKAKELKADWDKWSGEQMAPLWVPMKKKAKDDEGEG
ncbi:MAG: sulfatase [Isosphaera sp.]|nr:sulfatase [Isosphaera sp.]